MTPGTPGPVHVLILGSGTSTGIPVIGCPCPVCASEDPRNKRLRTSARVTVGGRVFLIDCGVDFRQQMLRHRTPHLDAVLLTHTHADHIHGLDDLRAFTFRRREPMPIYSAERFLDDIRHRFAYCFIPQLEGGGVPRLTLNPVEAGTPFDACGVGILPVEIMHGRQPILGYRFGPFAYLTDCSRLPEAALEQLAGVDTVVISALRPEPHSTHFSLGEAVEAVGRIGARKAWFIHMACRLDHAETDAILPPHIRLSYDGLEFTVGG